MVRIRTGGGADKNWGWCGQELGHSPVIIPLLLLLNLPSMHRYALGAPKASILFFGHNKIINGDVTMINKNKNNCVCIYVYYYYYLKEILSVMVVLGW